MLIVSNLHEISKLFSGKNKKKIINLLSAELAKRMMKVKGIHKIGCFRLYYCATDKIKKNLSCGTLSKRLCLTYFNTFETMKTRFIMM